MRVADRSTVRNYLSYLNNARNDYAETTNRIATGKRFTQISDDVSAGARVLDTRNNLYKVEKQRDNVKSIREELDAAESNMSTINDILKRVTSELMVKALNGTNDQATLNVYANEIAALKDEILQFANSQYGDKYLFGGTNAVSSPFSVDENTGRLQYNGVDVDSIQKDADGYFYMNGGVRTEIPMDDDVYLDIGLGIKMAGTAIDPSTGYKISYSGLDIVGFGVDADGHSNNLYNALNDIEQALRNGDRDLAGDLNDKLIQQKKEFMANMTDLGAKTQFLETMETRLTNTMDDYTKRIDNLMGVVPGEEETTLMMNDYALKAVLQLGSKILPTSLMDYIT